jgi:hypothetical protein
MYNYTHRDFLIVQTKSNWKRDPSVAPSFGEILNFLKPKNGTRFHDKFEGGFITHSENQKSTKS